MQWQAGRPVSRWRIVNSWLWRSAKRHASYLQFHALRIRGTHHRFSEMSDRERYIARIKIVGLLILFPLNRFIILRYLSAIVAAWLAEFPIPFRTSRVASLMNNGNNAERLSRGNANIMIDKRVIKGGVPPLARAENTRVHTLFSPRTPRVSRN